MFPVQFICSPLTKLSTVWRVLAGCLLISLRAARSKRRIESRKAITEYAIASSGATVFAVSGTRLYMHSSTSSFRRDRMSFVLSEC